MKVLTSSDGFPPLPPVQIGLMKRPGLSPSLMNAITDHIAACLDNISPAVVPDDLDAEPKGIGRALKVRAGQMATSW
jgi:hypothetical protein